MLSLSKDRILARLAADIMRMKKTCYCWNTFELTKKKTKGVTKSSKKREVLYFSLRSKKFYLSSKIFSLQKIKV